MNAIIGRPRVGDNRDVPMTARHRPVVTRPEPALHPARRLGGPTGGLRMPARRTSMQLHTKLVRRVTAAASAMVLLASLGAGVAAAGGPPKLGFYVDDVRYRTVGTPTDFSGTGAPASTYDTIYALGAGLANVADAKPGDTDFNGGRWAVRPITWNTTPVQLTNAEQVQALADADQLTIGDPIRYFFCSVNIVPPGQS